MKSLYNVAVVTLILAFLASCGGGGTLTPTITLLRPDGQSMATDASPIPLGAKIVLTFTKGVTSSGDRATVESQVRLLSPGGATLTGLFSWNEAFTELTFDPKARLKYQSTYTIRTGPETTDASASVSKASVQTTETTFQTMLKSDFNGDGFADLALAAPGKEIGGNARAGQLYVYNGAADGIGTTPTLTFNGTGEYEDSFGSAQVSADLNGDGYDDLIVGAQGRDNFLGSVEVYHGSSDGLAATPNTTLTGAQADAAFGSLVANIGDVNGDGFDDLSISSVRYDVDAQTDAGAMFIYYGSAAGIAQTADVSLMGENAQDEFGLWATAGDFNGDGFDDLVECAPAFNGNTGRASIYPGSADGLVTDAASRTDIAGENAGDLFGYVPAVADVNGDGIVDVAIGAPGWANGVGSVYVYEGSADGLVTASFDRLVGNTQPALFGFSAPAGDVDGDGFDDLLIGAIYAPSNARDGRAYVHNGSASGVEQNPSTTWEGSGAEYLGYVYPSLDLNGDGYPDAIVGAPYYDSERGRALIYYGNGSGFDATPVQLEGSAASDRFSDYSPLS